MDMHNAGTKHNIFQYLINHGNSWISQESIMASNNLLLTPYLLSQENIREVIKIEEMVSTSSDDGHCLGSNTLDSKDFYTFCRDEYKTYPSEVCSTQIPSTTHLMVHKHLHTTDREVI